MQDDFYVNFLSKMSDKYDNWERLVRAVLLREQLRELALMDSRESSVVSDYDSSSCDLSVGSGSSSSDHQALTTVNIRNKGQSILPMDYSDLMMNHTDWKAMLAPGENEVVWKSASLSFSLDKTTGKHCFMVGARGLEISETQHEFISCSESRFSEVAEVKYNLQPTHIQCVIESQRLSPDTIYGAHLVFKLEVLPSASDDDQSDDDFFLHESHKKLHSLNLFFESTYAAISSYEYESADVNDMEGVLQRTSATSELYVVDRGNGWKEMEIGNVYVVGRKRGQVRARLNKSILREPRFKGRLIVEGVEFRPTTYSISELLRSFRWGSGMGKQKQKEMNIIVLKVEVDSEDEKKKAMRAVFTLPGVAYVYMSKKDKELTAVGDDIDTVEVLSKLCKTWLTELLNSTKHVGYTSVFLGANPVFKRATLVREILF